jgi:hypothetical protein
MNRNTSSARDILRTPLGVPERLFGPVGGSGAKAAFRELAKRWHPDRNQEDTASVFRHILALWDAHLTAAADGRAPPRADGAKTHRLIDGSAATVRYSDSFAFDHGAAYVAADEVSYEFARASAGACMRAIAALASLPALDAASRAGFRAWLPSVAATFETVDGFVLSVARPRGAEPLARVLASSGGRLRPDQVAWIIGGAMRMVCWLQAVGIAHGSVSTASLFVDEARREVHLLGGWWTAERKWGRDGDSSADRRAVREVGQALLGHRAPAGLLADRSVPLAVANWIALPWAGDAFSDYARWETACAMSFRP